MAGSDDYRSLTIRTRSAGGGPTEAYKKTMAKRHGGHLPKWTAQGYVTQSGTLSHAAIIDTGQLLDGFVAAMDSDKPRIVTNKQDGSEFWIGYWDTLRKYGNGTTLKVVEPPGQEPATDLFQMEHRELDMDCPDCWHPTVHRPRWQPHPVTGRLVCQVCHPMPKGPAA